VIVRLGQQWLRDRELSIGGTWQLLASRRELQLACLSAEPGSGSSPSKYEHLFASGV
jgi:hypothetical protein